MPLKSDSGSVFCIEGHQTAEHTMNKDIYKRKKKRKMQERDSQKQKPQSSDEGFGMKKKYEN